MKAYPNFYESLKEAHMRILSTVVLYDGEPYYVLAVTDHRDDGVFRVYMDPLGRPEGMVHQNVHVPYEWHDDGITSRGQAMDKWMDKKENTGIIRKSMDSPKFDKFRPFPLGMCNFQGRVYFIERAPTRHTQQGLTQSMLTGTTMNLTNQSVGNGGLSRHNMPNIFSLEMYQTIKGMYPDAKECLEKLNDPLVGNEGAAFHRNFCFIRGPLDMMFLGYKEDIVGHLPHGDTDELCLGRDFSHVREAIAELELFTNINTMK